MDLVEALRLQVAWGADEALMEAPQDRRVVAPALPAPRAVARVAVLPAGPAEAARIAEECQSLEALEAAMRAFSGCALRDTATQLVFADGAADAKIVAVGEAPGGEEDRAGRPFVGPAGQLLDKMLASIGLDRRQVRIVNTVPWRPPGNRNPTDAEVAMCLPFLHRHLALMRPRLMVVLGAVAAKALLPEPDRQLGIRRLRGVWRQVEVPGMGNVACLATYHPAYLLRTPAAKAEAWLDLLSLKDRVEATV